MFVGATSVSAQGYYPTKRATSIEPGKQYMIYDASRDGDDRYAFRASNGSGGLKHSQTKPWDFYTTDAAYIWTVEEINAEKTAAHTYYLKTNAGTYAGPGGATNNTNGVEIMIDPWTTTTLAKSDKNCEAPDGSAVAHDAVTADMGLYVIGMGANLWNGNSGGGSWAKWSNGHPYALYEIGTVSAEMLAAYESLKNLAATVPAPNYFDLQTAYGVQDALTNYLCNKPEVGTASDNHPYSVLIDGNTGTYFHSAYNNAGSDPHYMQVNMGTAVTDFYFYMAPRNGNNRPQNVTISGSNSADGEFVKIADVKGITMDNGYLSYEISSETAYQYLRFTVTKTNTNTLFFTMSEFYVMPSNPTLDEAALGNVEDLNPAYNRSVTLEDIEARKAAIGMTITKEQVRQILEANAENHAPVPAFGQYATDDYNALQAAYDACTTAEGLDALIAAMENFNVNYPVFTINSNQKSYGVGMSIYDDGRDKLHFKTKNIADKQMLWIFETTSTTIGAGTYVVKNMATGNNFWGANNIVVYDNTDPHMDGVFTFKTNGTGNEVHAQQSGSEIVRWSAQEPDGGSAWTFTYVGESYVLNEAFKNMSETYGQTAAAAAQVYGFYADAANDSYYGDKTGQYPVSYKADIAAALSNFTTLQGSATNELELYLAGVTEEQIVDAKTAIETAVNAAKPNINMPKDGEAFVLMNVHEKNQKALQVDVVTWSTCLYSDCNTAVIEDVDLSFVYICKKMEDGQYALASNTGKYLAFKGISSNTASANGNKGYTDAYDETFSHLTIEAGQRFGCFAIKGHETGRQIYFVRYNGEGDVFNQSTGQVALSDQNYSSDFRFIEYPSYPNVVTMNAAAGIENVDYIATFSAPFATVLPEGVRAYYATEDAAEGSISLIEAVGAIPANQGVLLTAATADAVTMLPATTETVADLTANKLGNTAGAAAEINGYILTKKNDKVAFYAVSDNNTLGMNKAYLPALNPGSVLYLNFGGETTGIEGVEAENGTQVIFDLSGRRVQKAQKGLYIINGKKVVVK